MLRAGWLALLFVGVGLGLQLYRTSAETRPLSSNQRADAQPDGVASRLDEPIAPVAPPAAATEKGHEQPRTSEVAALSAGNTTDNQSTPSASESLPVAAQPTTSETSKPAGATPPPPVEMAAAPQPDAASMAAFSREVLAARASMGERDLEAAAQHLKAAESLARTPEQTSEVSRLNTVLAHLEEFWTAVRKKVAGLHSGQELTIQDIVIVVVEASKDQVVLRAQGRNYTYSVEQLPHTVALALAEMWLADVPSSKVFIGTYLTMEPKGDRERAQRVLAEAAQAGLDVSDVLAELRIAPPSTATRSGSSGSSTAGSNAASAGKSPIPSDPAKLREATDQIHEIFRADYAEANTPAGKLSLASKLLENAEKLADDPVARYVMLTEARDAAAEAGDPETASEAVEQLGTSYEIDALSMGLSVLQTLAQNTRGLDGHRDVAQAALACIPEAIKQKRLDEATKLADLAQASALKSRNVSLLRAARAGGEQVDAAKRKQ